MEKSPAELYKERVERITDAVQCKVPDRVPTLIDFGYLPARYVGKTYEQSLYDAQGFTEAHKKIIADCQPDIYQGIPFQSGLALEAVDSKVVKWPGHGVPPNSSHQYVEGEYMKADEYDAFLRDPTDFIVRTFLPRTCGTLKALQTLPPLTTLLTRAGMGARIPMMGDTEIVAAVESLQRASHESDKYIEPWKEMYLELEAMGFPGVTRFGVGPPFDFISDYLRGMRGTMLDMYRQPEKLLEAIDRILPMLIQGIQPVEKSDDITLAFCAPHRGSDGFMSIKQFEEFYWPGMKATILALIEAGITPYIFWEGDCTSRLEYILELPEGKVLNRFDKTDMFKAKEVLGGRHCIAGGVMPGLLQAGTVQEVKDHCKELIDVCGKDGGYILSTSVVMDEAKMENVRAMIDFTREYGVYHN